MPLRSLWFQFALSAGGGVWWAFCFDQRPGLLLPLAAAAPLFAIAAVPGSWRRLWLGWLHGVVAWLVAVPWIAGTLEIYGGLPGVASVLLLGLLALYLGLYHGLFCWLAGRLLARGDLLSLLLAPAVWVALEWVRGLGPSGFPWNLLAYAWVDVPGALDATRWIGSHGLSFLVAASGLALFRLAARENRRGAVAALVAVAALLAIARWTNLDRRPGDERRLDVAVVQPNIHMATAAMADGGPDEQFADLASNYERLFALSREACEPGRLVVWPESAGWPYQLERDGRFAADLEKVVAGGCSLLLNSARWDQSGDEAESGEEARAFNAAYLLTPGPGRAQRQTYDKMHLVPFGEYVPFGGLLPAVRQLARQAGGFSPGDEVRLLDADPARLGVSICFEIVFPQQVAARVRRGANLLVTITNDSWYGRTWAPHQHLRPARFRAAENGRPLVRAAITGISAVIDRRGRVLAETPIDEAMVMRARIVPLSGLTPFTRAPLLVPLLCVALAGFAILRR